MQFSTEEIKKLLPHRYPFLLVDRILECEPGKYAKGIKCVSANEMQFLGHFPEKSIFPGVFIVEALAQTGAVALLSMEENKGRLAFLGGIKNARFRKQVVPGDVLELECNIIRLMDTAGKGEAKAFVDGSEVCSMEITFALG